MIKNFSILLILVLCTVQMDAQPYPYENAAGVRAGYSSGFNYKHFMARHQAIDLYAIYHPSGFQVNGLYEYQVSPHFRNRLQYYLGAGGFAGSWDAEYAAGAALIAGGEFIFREIPLVIGVQWKPMLNAWKIFDIAWYDFGVTVLVVIN